MVIILVAVEKVGSSEKSRKSGDRKCPGDWDKSFVELPDAIQFLQIPSKRVFQQPRLLSEVTHTGCKYLGSPFAGTVAAAIILRWRASALGAANIFGIKPTHTRPSPLLQSNLPVKTFVNRV